MAAKKKTATVREPVQVYLAPDDSALLTRLAEESGLSKAEVLRRGVKSFARELGSANSPMLQFMADTDAMGWPDAVAADHDRVLADSYLGNAPARVAQRSKVRRT